MTTGWSPPIGDRSLEDESLESVTEIPGVSLMNKLPSMATYALREPLQKAVACLVDIPMMDSREYLPFNDVTSVDNMSQRFSPEVALLEAQLVLEAECLAVAEARARSAATVLALTKATSSSNSSVKSRGSRHKRSRTLPPLGDDHEPLEEDDLRDTLEDDLFAMISECQAEEELAQRPLM